MIGEKAYLSFENVIGDKKKNIRMRLVNIRSNMASIDTNISTAICVFLCVKYHHVINIVV